MTSPSRKSRRITAWSTAILISWAGSAQAQAPKPGADAPAPTTWQPYAPPTAMPKPAVTAAPTVPTVTVPDLPPLPQPIVPPKMVNYQKPANDAKPREAVNPIASPRPVQAAPVMASPAPVIAKPAVMARPAPVATEMVPQVIPPATGEPKSLGGTYGTLPSRLQLFRLDDDATLNSRIIQFIGPVKSGEKFPVAQPLSPPQVKYEPKTASYAAMVLLREPSYVIHRRLYFEEQNAERAGWDAGPAQNFISTAYFWRDTVMFPGKFASGCRNNFDSSAGKCMPGDPTPYYCYPPSDLTFFGGSVEAAVLTGAAFILP